MAAADYEASSTDLAKFFGRGGKLLLWHGLDDPGPSPFATLDYERAVKANGSSNIRFFAVPGMYHCFNGPGADRFDPLTALEQWVEKGVAPQTMIATNPTGTGSSALSAPGRNCRTAAAAMQPVRPASPVDEGTAAHRNRAFSIRRSGALSLMCGGLCNQPVKERL